MKRFLQPVFSFVFLSVCMLLLATGCQKSETNTNADASLYLSLDTLNYDTVFTTAGSVTRSFKIFNNNKQKLVLSRIRLAGGDQSAYKMNVSGMAGSDFRNVEMDAGDSLYVFVKVNIDPNDKSAPFLVRDSIAIEYNGNTAPVQLQAYGQNARYLRQARLTKDSSWDNALPVVVIGQLTVPEGKTLSIGKGCHIYCHADALLQINGSLQINGGPAAADRVLLTTDRLDEPYKSIPGSWPGIAFGPASSNNELNYATIRNAATALCDTILTTIPTATRISLNGCIIDNNSAYGLQLRSSSVEALNCQITNCGANIAVQAGGNYRFDFCTIAGYGNNYIQRSGPAVYLSNTNTAGTDAQPLAGSFTNCIIYGANGSSNDELVCNALNNSNFNLSLRYTLLKAGALPSYVQTDNLILNQDPLFTTIDNDRISYDFHLQEASPAIGSGIPLSGQNYDMEGNLRNTLKPDMGCYESK